MFHFYMKGVRCIYAFLYERCISIFKGYKIEHCRKMGDRGAQVTDRQCQIYQN